MKELFNLSAPQNSILLTEQYYSNTSINNIGGGITVHKILNFDLFKKAINNFVKYNDSFRIRLKQTKDGVKQYFEEYSEFDIEIIDLNDESEIEELDKKIMYRPMNIFENQLFEFIIFRLKNNHGGYVIKMHHLISDAWTSGLMCRKIMHEYSNLLNGINENCNSTLSYKNYLQSEEKYFNSEKFQKDKKYWEEKFSIIPNSVSIPSTSTPSNVFSCEGERSSFVISKKEMEQISKYCSNHSVSVFNFFMSILSIYINQINNATDFVIGTPILNRSNVAEKNTAGMFINIAPLRISFENINNFSELIHSISKDSMALLRHQKYPYQKILEDLRKVDSSVPNLYNIVLSYQITRSNNECDIPYDTRWASNGCTADDIDIHLYDMDEKGILNVAYDYKTSKYSYVDILNMHNRLMHIIKQILKNEEIEIKDIEIVTEEEKHKILYEFNNTFVEYPKDKTIVDLFEEQVEKTPDNIAVTCNGESLTYKELNEKANQLAWYLKENGIEKNSIISTCMNRNNYLIISILATLKLGCVYLPINPEYPIERILYILENSNSAIMLTNFESNLNFENKKNIAKLNFSEFNNKNLDIKINSNDLVYIIYTSGSTGNPKGVMVKHSNLINYIYSTYSKFNKQFSSNDNCLQISNISFDASICELFMPLAFGSTLVLYPENTLVDILLFCELLKKEKITYTFIPPNILLNVFNLIKDDKENIFLDKLSVGVEPIKNKLLNNYLELNPNMQIVNGYGPTETTICITYFKYEKNSNFNNLVPIGKPLDNNQIIIVNSNQNLLPIGIPGEILVSGMNVTKGYLNNKQTTEEKYININNKIFYKTGDIATWLPDGNIVFKNRNDTQVKFKGYRIELNEIDLNIKKIDNVISSITLIKEINNTSYICSYLTCDTQIKTEKIKSKLAEYLPNYMIPNFIIILNSMPLTSNGKIDKKSLPLPTLLNENIPLQEPRNNIDSKLLELYLKILNLDKISITNSFFELGGDSLSAINLSVELYNIFKIQLSVKDILEHPTISDLSDYIANIETSKTIINTAKTQDFYPASPAQKRMYYASKADSEESILYNIPGAIVFDSIPDIDKLKYCFDELFERHESLRTYFEIRNDDIVQIIAPNIGFKLDIQNSTSTNTDYLLKQFVKPFNLSKAPLFRATLVIQNNTTATLLIDMHHSISDGTSVGILLEEIEKLYNGKTLDENTLTYKDYSEWERDNFESTNFKESEKFWIDQFSDELPVLNMPTTYQRPVTQSFEGSSFNFIIDKKLKNKIFKTCTELSITPYMFLLSAYYVLLYKYTNQDDIIIGTPVSGRNLSEVSNIVGMFVNSLPLRANIKSSVSFKKFLTNIKKVCLNSFEHQDYPFDFLVNKLDLPRNSNRSALFDTMFVYENFGLPKLNLKNINSTYVPIKNTISKYDFSLQITPTKDGFDTQFEYCTKLFDEKFIEKLANSYIKILENAVADISTKISDIEIISEEENNKILYEFNNTKVDYNTEKNIQNIFEEHAQQNPDNIAVVFENEKITYSELNKKANQLANYLIQNGIKPNDILGVMINRSIETIICMLGILKSGAAYMLIDHELPKDRIEFMLNNCKSKLLITSSKLKKIDFENKFYIDKENLEFYNILNSNIVSDMTDNLSVVYTSGSTGLPKGILLHRQGMINLMQSYKDILQLNRFQTFLSTCSVSFDMFAVEVFSALYNGKTLILANEEEAKIPNLMADLINKYKVEFMLITPSKIQLLLANENIAKSLSFLKSIQLGGEALTIQLYNEIKKYTSANIYNQYGPSEITACCCLKQIINEINIGSPLNNTNIYILDTNLNLCPIGVSGEICIAGDGVSKGYINNNELTKKSFIKNPFGEGYMYKSGDIGKYTENGEIEYIGRKDFQIKIRGLRVELSEIENKFLEIPEIENCSVIYKKEENDSYLVAYFTTKNEIEISSIRQTLSKNLPLYMVPKYIIKLDNLPITINGKVNKKELENRKINLSENKKYIAPENDIQQLFCDIWSKLLNIKIGIDDNIFESGVDSLIAIKFKTELLSHNINLPYANLFKYPTVRELSEKTELQESTSNIETFDYTKINKVLEKNNMETLQNTKMTHNHNNNILLLGSNGFVGSHILYNFIKQDLGKAYCIIRERNNKSAKNRLVDTLHFYFNTELDSFIDDRIIILQGDITKEKFGLEDEIYNDLTKKISTIINSAAIVKHYGDIKKFNNVNIKLTEKLCNYAIENNKKLMHVSTMSISESSNIDATYVASKKYENTEFSENNFYIGQILDNAYTASKFEAERIILNNMATNNLNAKIIRLGNITNRYSDGVFQINADENAFANRLKSFINLNTIPEYLQALPLEFTPVDLCAKAIIYILQNNIKDFSVYHLYNNNSIYLKNFVDILSSNDIKIEFVDQKKFKTIIKKKLEKQENELSGIVNDLNDNYELIYERDVNLSGELTQFFLKIVGFEWPEIDENYIVKYINYMKKINFFKEDK